MFVLQQEFKYMNETFFTVFVARCCYYHVSSRGISQFLPTRMPIVTRIHFGVVRLTLRHTHQDFTTADCR